MFILCWTLFQILFERLLRMSSLNEGKFRLLLVDPRWNTRRPSLRSSLQKVTLDHIKRKWFQKYFTKLYSILFYSILFYSIFFNSIIFYSIQFYSTLFYSILFYSILFYSVLFYSILFYSILLYYILLYSILFYSILFYSIFFYSILFYYILFCSTIFYSTQFNTIWPCTVYATPQSPNKIFLLSQLDYLLIKFKTVETGACWTTQCGDTGRTGARIWLVSSTLLRHIKWVSH
jgi:hypothetical protein